MAYNDVVQAIADAEIDAQTLEDVINGAPDTQVKSRLGRYIWTLSTINSKIEYVRTQASGAITAINADLQNAQTNISNATAAANAAIASKLNALDAAINNVTAELAASKNWTANLVADESGLTQQQINNLAKAWQPVFVEQFRQAGYSDSQTIQAALDFINANLQNGTRLIFDKSRLYTYDSNHSIKYINNLLIDLNGATLKRANASTTSTTLAADMTVANNTTLNLTSVPKNWKVGDYVTAYTSHKDVDTVRDSVRITAINGNTVTVSGLLYIDANRTVLPAGTRVAKVFAAFAGRPSSPDSTVPLDYGINRRIFITNGTIDGNKDNQLTVSWRAIFEIVIHTIGGVIDNVNFKNCAGETVVGHGICVQNCVYENIGGSCYHTSLNDMSAAQAGNAKFINNIVKGANLAGTANIGHSEGAITFSWSAGNFIISGNLFENLSECVLGAFTPSTGDNPDKFLITTNNIVKGAKGIFADIMEPALGVMIEHNIFHDCGDNIDKTKALAANSTCVFANNVLTGNTLAYQAASNDAVLLGAKRQSFSSPTRPKIYAANNINVNYTPSFESDTLAVFENTGDAFVAYVSNGMSGHSYFSKDNANAQAYNYFDATTKKFVFGTNTENGSLDFKTGGYQTKMRVKADVIDMPNFTALVMGDSDVDGSWRFYNDGTNMLLQKRISGVWTTKQTFA